MVAASGLLFLLALAGVMWLRRADPVEIWAILLFLPIFLAVVLWRTVGGLVTAVLASGVYVALRLPAIEAVGFEQYAGVVVGRSAAYLVFGVVGGWAMSRLQRSLTKLDLYDQIDDLTGLFNARFLAQQIELELARAARYQTVFSVVVLDVPRQVFNDQSGRRRARTLRTLGQQITGAIRTVDRGAHIDDGRHHRFALILPETPAEGAEVFAHRFRGRLVELLSDRRIPVEERDVGLTSITVPGGESELAELREQARALVGPEPVRATD